jgi:hypothetical protein
VLSATGAVLVDPSPQALTTIAIVTAITMTRKPRHRRRRDDVDVPDRKSSRRTAKLGRSAGGLRTARPPSRDSVESSREPLEFIGRIRLIQDPPRVFIRSTHCLRDGGIQFGCNTDVFAAWLTPITVPRRLPPSVDYDRP